MQGPIGLTRRTISSTGISRTNSSSSNSPRLSPESTDAALRTSIISLQADLADIVRAIADVKFTLGGLLIWKRQVDSASASTSKSTVDSETSNGSSEVLSLKAKVAKLSEVVDAINKSLLAVLVHQSSIDLIRQSQLKLEATVETLLTWRAEELALRIAQPPASSADVALVAAEVAANTSQMNALREIHAKMALDIESRVVNKL